MAERPRRGTHDDEEFFRRQLGKKGQDIFDKIPQGAFLYDISRVGTWKDADYRFALRTRRRGEIVQLVFWEWTPQALVAMQNYRDTQLSWNELFVLGHRWDLKGVCLAVENMIQVQDALGRHGPNYRHHAVHIVKR